MPTGPITMLHVAVGVLLIVLFCQALRVIIRQTKNVLVGNRKDSIKQLRDELDALKLEFNMLKTQIQGTASSAQIEQSSLVPAAARAGQMALDDQQPDTWARGSFFNA